MHPNTTNARRFLTRGLAASLLLAQPALSVFAQTNTSSPATNDTTKQAPVTNDQPVVMQAFNVVGGFRGSLGAAAQAKEQSADIVEVIAVEDIGKLPDVSIADSLTRLTGLATQRTNGRAQAISIRGLTGDFSTGMLNGREQVSTGENRAVEFDQYPAELLNGVTVYKTAAANLTGQGLAGTIDLQTVEPLSKSGRTIAMNGYYEWTQFSQLTPGANAKGNRFNLSYVDQLAGGTVGVALGYSHSSKPYEGEQFQAWGYPTDSAGNFMIGGTKSYVRTSNLDRDGLMAVLEFKPNENIHSTIDIYTSKFDEKQLLLGMEIPLAFWSSAVLTPGYTISGGLITQAKLTNVQPVVRNDVFERKDSPVAFGWNLKLGQKSEWPVVFDTGYSRVTRTDENLETWSGLGSKQVAANPDTMTVQLIPGQIPVITSTLSYANGSVLKLSDPQNWGSAGYVKFLQAKDELGQFKLSTTHAMTSVFKDFEIGASYSDRYKKDGENPSEYVNVPNGAATAPLPPQVGTTDMSFLGLGPIYAYDPLAAYNAGVWSLTPNTSTDMAVNTFQVREKISQAYLQFDLDSKVGDVPVTGNVGLRAIRTDQNSTGYSANAGVLNPVSGGDKYTKFAPSMNLTFKPGNQTYIRFSVARQIARPRMYDMRASQSWSYDPTLASSTDLSRSPWSASGGNTKLQPWQANSIDLSLEKYFKDNMGYVSLSLFQKNLISYIYNQTVLQNFTNYPVRSGGLPVLFAGPSGEPQNGTGGSMKGLEATVSLPSELLSKEVRGFGVVLGGAYTDSSIQPWGPGNGTAPIAGLSRKVANVTFYYERYGFSARISDRYRSSTREYITTFGPPNRAGDASAGAGFSVAQPEKVVDAQLGYSLQSGAAKGLTFFLQAYNLNNEPLITYNNGDPRQVMNYQKYGASYSLGASYKF
jgi:iron complex outermembrane recepter protein